MTPSDASTATDTPNADQLEYWNGPTGHKWAKLQERIDGVFAPLTARLLERAAPKPGERAIDVGCGAGDVSLALAAAAGPSGHVTGLDISAPMLAQARRRADAAGPGVSPTEFIEGDAGVLAVTPPADLMTSRFGVMFFADPTATFANLRRSLKPGARLAMMCWRKAAENEWAHVPSRPILDLLGEPEPTPPGAPGPFAFADPDRVVSILTEAGFADAGATKVDVEMEIGRGQPGLSALDDALVYAMDIGPAARLLREVTDEAIRARARAAIAEVLAGHVRDDAVRLGAAVWIYEAVNPG